MKRLLISAATVLILVGCGKKQNVAVNDSDTLDIVTELEGDTVPSFYITSEGIGNVKIGEMIDDLPDMVTGLYNTRQEGNHTEAHAVMFNNNTGTIFTALDFMEGKIDMLYLDNAYVKVKGPEGDFCMGDSFDKVLSLPGVRAEWEESDQTGEWYWTWEGLWLGVDPQNLPVALQQRLYDGGKEPAADDFNENVTIGYIGTGLAF